MNHLIISVWFQIVALIPVLVVASRVLLDAVQVMGTLNELLNGLLLRSTENFWIVDPEATQLAVSEFLRSDRCIINQVIIRLVNGRPLPQ